MTVVQIKKEREGSDAGNLGRVSSATTVSPIREQRANGNTLVKCGSERVRV